MDYKKALGMMENLLAKVEQGQGEDKEDGAFLQYGSGESALTFRGEETVNAFRDTIDYFWEKDKDLFETISQKKLQKELINFIRGCLNGEELSLDRIKDFFRNLKNEPITNFEVFYQVYGAEYYKADPLKIGPYTIYNLDIHRNVLLEKYPHIENNFEFKFGKKWLTARIMISVFEKAREFKRANEKARTRLRQFEDTIRFIIGGTNKRYDIGIFNFNAWKVTGGVFLLDKHYGSTNKGSGTIDKILLNKFPINEPKYGHDKLWEMLDKDNPTQLEQRIISAIAWAGKALRDEEPARALTQYAFGLEALLQFRQKDEMVSPSITYQMSELAAFLVAEDLENRLKMEKVTKNIYSRRSAIAHGGSHKADNKILHEALFLLKSLITILTTNDTFKDFKTIEEIAEWVKKEKYS